MKSSAYPQESYQQTPAWLLVPGRQVCCALPKESHSIIVRKFTSSEVAITYHFFVRVCLCGRKEEGGRSHKVTVIRCSVNNSPSYKLQELFVI